MRGVASLFYQTSLDTEKLTTTTLSLSVDQGPATDFGWTAAFFALRDRPGTDSAADKPVIRCGIKQ